MPEDDATSQRFNYINERLARIERVEPVVLASRLNGLADDVKEIQDEVRGLRKAVIGFALTVAGSAVVFAITALSVWSP